MNPVEPFNCDMKVLYWGTYDTGKPRNRILIRGLGEAGVKVSQCHYELWSGIEDKSQIKSLGTKLRFLARWLFCYPGLIVRFMKSPRPDVVIIGYLGHVDVIVIWIFAKLRGIPVVWDAFISLYDTVVCDRKLLHRYNPLAILLYCWEWLACRAVDLVILDTVSHARLFIDHFGVKEDKTTSVYVGVEPEIFSPRDIRPAVGMDDSCSVLFYGQFIPLHGIETIIEAARLLKDEGIDWTLIGTGQETERIAGMLREEPLAKLNWVEWVEYEELVAHIHQADICLGIFGSSDKAARVVPNKVYQILATGMPLITRTSPAMDELVEEPDPGIIFVAPASPHELAEAICAMRGRLSSMPQQLHGKITERVTPERLGLSLRSTIEEKVLS